MLKWSVWLTHSARENIITSQPPSRPFCFIISLAQPQRGDAGLSAQGFNNIPRGAEMLLAQDFNNRNPLFIKTQALSGLKTV